jgi:hypothetical protein
LGKDLGKDFLLALCGSAMIAPLTPAWVALAAD